MTEYLAQVEHQRDQARRDLRSAENELAKLRALPAQLAAAKTELAALHQGEELYDDDLYAPTPGQWIWRWNRATPEERLEIATNRLDLLERLHRCVNGMHEQRIAEYDEHRQAARIRAEKAEATKAAVERINTHQMLRIGQLADVEDRLHEAEARIAAVRALHRDDYGLCMACSNSHGVPWPCPTATALDGPADARQTTPSTPTETSR